MELGRARLGTRLLLQRRRGRSGKPRAGSCDFFAYEWINPRLGKVVQEVRLKGTTGFRGGSDDFNNEMGPVIASNAVILAALSIVKKRS